MWSARFSAGIMTIGLSIFTFMVISAGYAITLHPSKRVLLQVEDQGMVLADAQNEKNLSDSARPTHLRWSTNDTDHSIELMYNDHGRIAEFTPAPPTDVALIALWPRQNLWQLLAAELGL